MKQTLALCMAAWVLAGCNSGGETSGQGGGGQGGAHKTGITFFTPQNPTHGYYVDAFNSAFMAINLDENADNPAGIKLSGSELGTVFVTSESPATISVKSGTPDLTFGDNTVQILSASSFRNINARMGVRNFSSDVTSRDLAPIIREMRVYGFEERIMSAVNIYVTTLSGFQAPPALPPQFEMIEYINSVYNQAVLLFDAAIYLSHTLSTSFIGNEDGILDIYQHEPNLGPEMVELLRSIPPIAATDHVGFYVRDFSMNLSHTGALRKGDRTIFAPFDIEGLLSPDDRLIIGPASPEDPNQCVDLVQVNTVFGRTITLIDQIECDEHPVHGSFIGRNHYIRQQNSNSALGLAFSSRNFFIVEARSLNDIKRTVAHEVGHLPNVGDFDDNEIPENLMNTIGSGTHLRNDQWEALNR